MTGVCQLALTSKELRAGDAKLCWRKGRGFGAFYLCVNIIHIHNEVPLSR